MKLSDFVANYFASTGLINVFMLTGGGAMHLNNSLGKHPQIKTTYLHHEQACSIAAESYARLIHKPAIVNVTTGPGGINALNGVFGAWTDSMPMIVISGQVRYDTTVEGSGITNLRQMGDQECDIVRMVKGITKYSVMIKNPQEILYHLQKAAFLASYGRPGPVWLDIPMNIQSADIDENHLITFNPQNEYAPTQKISHDTVRTIIEKIKFSKRPVILAGTAIRSSGSQENFLKLLDRLKIPVATAWNAHDILCDEHTNYVGRPGTVGDRAGNFAVQNADLLLVLGSRLNIRQISYNWTAFAREAYKIVVDIDDSELQKPTLKIDLAINGDIKQLIELLLNEIQQPIVKKDWMNWCRLRREKFPVVSPEYWLNKNSVNPYCFMQALSSVLPDDQIIVTGDGTAAVVSFQSFVIKKNTRLYSNSGCASMGYDIPAAIGACIASGGKKIICLAGDGSAMQNIQELASIVYHRYPIKIFLLNNNGYHSIRETQQNFFGLPFIGVGEDSGLGFPNFEKLAAGFEIPYTRCIKHENLTDIIQKVISDDQPHLCEVMLSLEQVFSPKLSSKQLPDGRIVTKPLEDMAPFLSHEEMKANMLIPMISEDENKIK